MPRTTHRRRSVMQEPIPIAPSPDLSPEGCCHRIAYVYSGTISTLLLPSCLRIRVRNGEPDPEAGVRYVPQGLKGRVSLALPVKNLRRCCGPQQDNGWMLRRVVTVLERF